MPDISYTKVEGYFFYLRHCVPRSVPSSVKFNFYRSCVVSVLLYGYPVWSLNNTTLLLSISIMLVLNGAMGPIPTSIC